MNNTNIISKLVDDYKSMLIAQNGRLGRLSQVDDILNALIKKFKVDGPINIIETGASQSWGDGMMGTLFANIAKHTGGKMWVVDIDPIITEKAKAEFTKLGFDFVKFHVGDSVEFLETFNERVDLIHLDSWDLNLKDPLPSALHGWREFAAIKDKLLPGAIIIVDDNFEKGTWVTWYSTVNGSLTGHSERVDIIYPCVGKGAHIKFWAESKNTDWNIIKNKNTNGGRNFKVICQKS
jgi:spermidine synthase